jgi:hypothetical protein
MPPMIMVHLFVSNRFRRLPSKNGNKQNTIASKQQKPVAHIGVPGQRYYQEQRCQPGNI